MLKSCDKHTKQYRKSIALVAAMRLKCHQPNESLEILSIYDDIDVNIRYIRVLSYTHLNQFDRVFPLLEMTLTSTVNNQPVPKIPDQLVTKLKKLFSENVNSLCYVCVFFSIATKSRTETEKDWR